MKNELIKSSVFKQVDLASEDSLNAYKNADLSDLNIWNYQRRPKT